MTMISWKRMLIRMGFVVKTVEENMFSFMHENDANIEFFQKILDKLNVEYTFKGLIFTPENIEVNEEEFLSICESIQGDQTYFEGFANVQLIALDTYISGLVRWLNAIGFTTTICCDGHNRTPAHIGFKNREAETRILNYSLSLVTNQTWSCSPRGHFRIRTTNEDNRSRTERPKRELLLDLAEALYEKRTILQPFVQAGLELSDCPTYDWNYSITQRAAEVGERIQLKAQSRERGVLYEYATVKEVVNERVCVVKNEKGDVFRLAVGEYYVIGKL
ncbi:hypothetical protein [Bacillus sp. FJAT-45350]|uniref:hypothetical protein n=1 Tax=Bacillus sp. FJAT-45350 TaxID=2011014 RepID=UPI000BB9ABC4|nr:hypothetical protein [Bacillus sp. FJAT-45350]